MRTVNTRILNRTERRERQDKKPTHAATNFFKNLEVMIYQMKTEGQSYSI